MYNQCKHMRNNENVSQEVTELLSKLQLWSNDPSLGEGLRPFAECGNSDAQYAMGLIYAEGRGVQQSNQQAYIWLSRAIQRGDQDADLLRSIVMQGMTISEIQDADSILHNERKYL